MSMPPITFTTAEGMATQVRVAELSVGQIYRNPGTGHWYYHPHGGMCGFVGWHTRDECQEWVRQMLYITWWKEHGD